MAAHKGVTSNLAKLALNGVRRVFEEERQVKKREDAARAEQELLDSLEAEDAKAEASEAKKKKKTEAKKVKKKEKRASAGGEEGFAPSSEPPIGAAAPSSAEVPVLFEPVAGAAPSSSDATAIGDEEREARQARFFFFTR